MELAAWSGATDGPAVRDDLISRPELFRRLTQARRVVQISAPPGSGKTVLLRSWIAELDLAGCAAWVSVPGGERDPQRLWVSVTGALRATAIGSALVRELTVAPDLDGWAVVERLLADLAALPDRVWLVLDDLHELGSAEALRQLELLIMRAPPALRFILVTRHDLRLGLHRLRVAGELTEIRAADLRFSLDEARALFAAAGVVLAEQAAVTLYERTEGWAAGLRLAALSLAGYPDPERFAAEFGGSERTVAEYLMAEVLERQGGEARRLLLRTSILDRVNGELADLLTGGSGGERLLQQLEEAGAFVLSLDARRSWFRYHQLFADLLQLELRASAPDESCASVQGPYPPSMLASTVWPGAPVIALLRNGPAPIEGPVLLVGHSYGGAVITQAGAGRGGLGLHLADDLAVVAAGENVLGDGDGLRRALGPRQDRETAQAHAEPFGLDRSDCREGEPELPADLGTLPRRR